MIQANSYCLNHFTVLTLIATSLQSSHSLQREGMREGSIVPGIKYVKSSQEYIIDFQNTFRHVSE